MFFFSRCNEKRMYFQSKKLTNVIILFWREIYSFFSINIATKHPRALTIESVARILVITKESGTIARKTGSPLCAIYSSRDQSSDMLTNFLDSQLDTQGSILETRGLILETIEDRGSRDCQLTFERYFNI